MRARVERNEPIGPGAYRLSLVVDQPFGPVEPGQFVMLRVGAGLDPLLPRPFSVYRMSGLPGQRVVCEVVYRVVGRGTAMLSAMARGVVLDLAGPYGRGFRLPGEGDEARAGEPASKAPPEAAPRGGAGREGVEGTAHPGGGAAACVLVAGGIGIASLHGLAAAAGRRFGRGRVHVLFGAKTGPDLICIEDLGELPVTLDLATEDGSHGWRGTIVERLRARSAEGLLGAATTVYACGPHGMLKAVAEIASAAGAGCQVALERLMACGMGACLGCAVRVRGGSGHGAYEMVCKDGPVFDAARVDWER